MEDEHRAIIHQNLDDLIRNTNYKVLMENCQRKRILFNLMASDIESSSNIEAVKHRRLFEKITHRGPKAFDILRSICAEHFPRAFDILSNGLITNSITSTVPSTLTLPSTSTTSSIIPSLSSSPSTRQLQPLYHEVQDDDDDNENYISIKNQRKDNPVQLERSPSQSQPARTAPYQSNNKFSLLYKYNSNYYNDSNNINNNNNNSNNNHNNQNTDQVDSNGTNNILTLTPYTKEVNPIVRDPVIKSTKFHDDPKIPCYQMRSRNRGVFFLVNIINFIHKNEHRNGALVDRDNLIALFRGLGFTVFYYEDLTCTEFYEIIDQLVISRYLAQTDCLVFGILTHGTQDLGQNFVEFCDSSITDTKKILEKFNNNNCKNLCGKPKVFLFPFCRGNVADRGVPYSPKTEEDSISGKEIRGPFNLPTFSDMKICFASVPGFQSLRDPQMGSWYIEVMCQIWAQHAHDCNIDYLVKMVGERTGARRAEDGRQQTSSNEDLGFNKLLYFNPGYYGE